MSKTVSLACMAVLGLAAGIACYFLIFHKRKDNSRDSKRCKTEENATTRGQCKGLTDRGDDSVTLPGSHNFPVFLQKTQEDCPNESSALVGGEACRDVAKDGPMGLVNVNGLHEGFPLGEGDYDRRVNGNQDEDGEAAETVTFTDAGNTTYGDKNDYSYKGGNNEDNEVGDNLSESAADDLESDVKKYQEIDTMGSREEDIKELYEKADTKGIEKTNHLNGPEGDSHGGQVDMTGLSPLSERVRSDVEDSASNGETNNTLNVREKGDEAVEDRRGCANYDKVLEAGGPSIVADKVENEMQGTPVSEENMGAVVNFREEEDEAAVEKREVTDVAVNLDENCTSSKREGDETDKLSIDSPVMVEKDRGAEISPGGEETENVDNVTVEEDEPAEIQKLAGAAVEVVEHLTEEKRENEGKSETEIEDTNFGKADQVERVNDEGDVAQLSEDWSDEGNTCSSSSDRPNGHLTETDGSEKDREIAEETVICPERECEKSVDPREGEAEVEGGEIFRRQDEKNGVDANAVDEASVENADSDSSDRWQQSSSGKAECVEQTEAPSAAEDKRSKKKNRRRNKRKTNANGGGSEISNQF